MPKALLILFLLVVPAAAQPVHTQWGTIGIFQATADGTRQYFEHESGSSYCSGYFRKDGSGKFTDGYIIGGKSPYDELVDLASRIYASPENSEEPSHVLDRLVRSGLNANRVILLIALPDRKPKWYVRTLDASFPSPDLLQLEAELRPYLKK